MPETPSPQEDPSTSVRSLRGMIASMTPQFAFRTGFVVGVLALSAVLFVFLFGVFGVNRQAITGQPAGSDSDAAANAEEAAGGLPSPYEEVKGDVALRDDDHIRGDRNADILLIEYSDYECPFCKNFHDTAQDILTTYTSAPSVAWVYRHFPLEFHEGAHEAAEASECVAELAGEDAFWAFTDGYYERTRSNGNGYAREKWGELAADSGVRNVAAFETCVNSGKYAAKVDADIAEGTSLGVNGTPGNIVLHQASGNARLVAGAYPLDAFDEVFGIVSP